MRRLLGSLLLKGGEERRYDQQDQEQDQAADQTGHLTLAARGLLDQRLGERGAGGEAAEEGGQDVAEADGVQLLVGVHGVVVLLGEHLRQRDGDGEAHHGDGEGVHGHAGDQRPHGQQRRHEARGDVTRHAGAVLGVEVAKVGRQRGDDHHEELKGDWSLSGGTTERQGTSLDQESHSRGRCSGATSSM